MENSNNESSKTWTINQKHEPVGKDPNSLDESISNDGMTATSARRTGGGDEHTPSTAGNNDSSEKPGAEYNINDQAYSQSSKEDFVKTVSNFEHEDGTKPPAAKDSQHLMSPD